MRRTNYATEIARASVEYPGENEARIERLFVNDAKREEIRFSWWRGNRLMMRPLDLPEDDLLTLIEKAIDDNVLSRQFVSRLRALIAEAGGSSANP